MAEGSLGIRSVGGGGGDKHMPSSSVGEVDCFLVVVVAGNKLVFQYLQHIPAWTAAVQRGQTRRPGREGTTSLATIAWWFFFGGLLSKKMLYSVVCNMIRR